MAIRDGMTSKLRKITTAFSRANREIRVTGALSDQVQPGSGFDRAKPKIDKTSESIRQFNNRMDEAREKTLEVESGWSGVKSAVVAAISAIGVAKVIDLADTMTTTSARIDMINNGLQDTAELQSQIMASANRSRAAYQTTADAVTKMGIMAKDAFTTNGVLNTDELIAFTELINKQFTIAGTSAAGVDAAMLQLTQAMSSGVLRGEELNSIFEQAPTIIQSIADYLDVPIGKIRSMAQEGQITATIVKNAMFDSATQINEKFNSMPMTFAQVGNIVKNVLLDAFGPAIQVIGSGAQWIYDNWSRIEPVVSGVATAVGILVAAYVLYNAVQGITNTLQAISTARAAMQAGMTIAQAAATKTATGAQVGLNAAMLANPMTWVILVIAALVGAIIFLIQKVGGLKNAWEICKAALVVAWTALKVAFFAVYNWIANLIDKLKLCWQKAGTAIANFMGDMKVSVLTVLQNMINGAIGIINDFISLLNKIPGVNISLIEQVTFATTAAAENEAAKQARADALNQYEADIKAAQAERDATYSAAKQELADATAQLSETYANARAEAAQANSDAGVSDWNTDQYDVGNVDSVGSVGSIESDVNIADEDLKFLRDVAEMRYVQNFVTLTPTVAVDAQISEKVDVDEVVTKIEKKLEDEFTAAAEGVYN
ncbi:MAG: tape measure protein [Firmicutes bacterium]|nr:tape measure protein [Bacillota bacterium]